MGVRRRLIEGQGSQPLLQLEGCRKHRSVKRKRGLSVTMMACHAYIILMRVTFISQCLSNKMQALPAGSEPQIIQKFAADPKKVLENARRGKMEDLTELASFWDSVCHPNLH